LENANKRCKAWDVLLHFLSKLDRRPYSKCGGSSKGTMKNPLTNQPEGVRWWAPMPHRQSYSGSAAAGIWQKINKTF